MANNLRFIGQKVPGNSRLRNSIDVSFVQATVIGPLRSKIKPVLNMFNYLKNENDEQALRCLTQCELEINTILSSGSINTLDGAAEQPEDNLSPKR